MAFHESLFKNPTLSANFTDGFTAGDVSPAIYKARIAQIRTQQATLGQASARTSVSAERLADAVARTLQLATSLWDLYEQFDDAKRAELLRGVFNAIVLDHDASWASHSSRRLMRWPQQARTS